MTFLRGTTTVGQLSQKLTQLICGEVADDTAVTNAVGDRWVRETTRTVTDAVTNSTTTLTSATAAFTATDYGSNVIGAGIPAGTTIASVTNATTVVLSAAATASASGVTAQIALDTIRTPSAKDVNTGSISNRAGYFTLLGTASQTPPMGVAQSTVCKVTNPFTSDPSTSGFHRWITWVAVVGANTVPGNYSTASIRATTVDADNNANLGTVIVTLNAAGLGAVTNGLTVTLSDPSGTLPLNTYWVRAFSATYMYGIDWWPMLYRAAAAPTFSVAPPGVAGTDYDVLNTHAPAPRDYSNTGNPYQGVIERSSLFNGLAIKTATGMGANPLYTLSFPMAFAKGRIFAQNNSTLSLDIGQVRVDPVNPLNAVRNVGGFRQTTWMQFAVTNTSMTTATQVQYWLSVKNDGIALVVNADPGGTGKMGIAYWGTLVSPGDPTYDVLPVVHSFRAVDYTQDVAIPDWSIAAQYNYWSIRRRQDGSEGTRDWQTRWMRGEGHWAFSATSWAMYAGAGPTDQTSANPGYTGSGGGGSQLYLYYLSTFPPRQNKPTQDGKWWMYPITFTELPWATQASAAISENYVIRGSLARVMFLPGDQWANGDELTDTVSGTKYLCVMPDYIGVMARGRIAANSYVGGPVVVEV